jgi:hypothetical protein
VNPKPTPVQQLCALSETNPEKTLAFLHSQCLMPLDQATLFGNLYGFGTRALEYVKNGSVTTYQALEGLIMQGAQVNPF